MSNSGYRINQQIQSQQLRVLREDGAQIGVLPLTEALSQAQESGVDLVEIAPKANPPVAKLVDFKKFLYQQAKKEAAAKATAKKVDLKEIRLTPFIAANDFDHRINQGREFLADGHKLRITVKFVGRQLTHKEFGPQMMDRVASALGNSASLDQPGKWVGKQYIATFTAIKKTKNDQTKNQEVSR